MTTLPAGASSKVILLLPRLFFDHAARIGTSFAAVSPAMLLSRHADQRSSAAR
jgi:hypothetical protein